MNTRLKPKGQALELLRLQQIDGSMVLESATEGCITRVVIDSEGFGGDSKN